MKKTLTILSLILMSTTAYAAKDRRCGMPDTDPCRENFSRIDAFDDLLDAEGGNVPEAQENLNLILETHQRYKVSLEYWTDNFIYILEVAGGYGYTPFARAAFSKVVSHLDVIAAPMHELTTQMVRMIRKEGGNVDDGVKNFEHVMNSVNSGKVDLDDGMTFFRYLLELLGGYGYTDEARLAFTLLVSSPQYTISDLYWNFVKVYKAEGGNYVHAAGNFELVIQAADQSNGVGPAAELFTKLLSKVGGYGYTDQAREVFKQVCGL